MRSLVMQVVIVLSGISSLHGDVYRILLNCLVMTCVVRLVVGGGRLVRHGHLHWAVLTHTSGTGWLVCLTTLLHVSFDQPGELSAGVLCQGDGLLFARTADPGDPTSRLKVNRHVAACEPLTINLLGRINFFLFSRRFRHPIIPPQH